MKIKVGCCGYPVSKSKYYETFEVIEIQSTFYKLPKIETVIKWRNEAPEKFEFIIKAWQAITHPWNMPTWRKYGKNPPPGKLENYGLLRYTDENINAWEQILEICKAMNCNKILIQLPPRLMINDKNIREILSFLEFITESKLNIIIEPRHESWKDDRIKMFFDEKKIVHCVDPFKDKAWGTGDFYYYRLHGMDGYNYSYRYKDNDLTKLINIVSEHRKDTYVMFNNKYMFDDAIRFMNLLLK